MESNTEKWRDVVGYEGVYAVSNTGKVMRIGKANNAVVGGLLNAFFSNGYERVSLSMNSRKRKFTVHSLVADAFLGHSNGKQVNHIDGVKENNNLRNLEYVTARENTRHAFNLGLREGLKGERNPSNVLSEEQVLEIRKLAELGDLSQRKIAHMYGISQGTVSDINNKKSWGWLK